MPQSRPILSLSCLTVALAFALAACGTQAPPEADEPSLEQRLFDLERRSERMEARPAVLPPHRSKEETQAHVKTLEAERSKMLIDYLPQHPAIKDITAGLRFSTSS